ncbi:hypothetical protein [Streptomyces sp. YIM S03343]
MGAHWTDVPELVDREVAGIRARVDQAQGGGWYVAPATEMGLAPGTVRTRVDGYQRTVGQFVNVQPADLELILRAHGDLSWCLDMVAKFRARVAELEAERHTTNEALSDAAEALRTQRDRVAELEALKPAAIQTCQECGAGYTYGESCSVCLFQARMAAEAQALREDDPGRCLEAHPFSPRDGWRLICGSCDHVRDAECHQVALAPNPSSAAPQKGAQR